MKLHSQKDPVSSLYLQGLLQHSGRLLPVRVLAQGADADLLVQVDLVPEGNCCYSARGCSLDLDNMDQGVNKILNGSWTRSNFQFQSLLSHF